ncbi:CCA tRNA nucleotidyltransferase [Solirubrobacter sp. CPCC 204708]|uniref:CCA tRNA nucleotidyltransferase n=1 Tax=Solirubrobacter deserti TaxID=2282478 RepID=A0ABT4RSB3_9ACTN|nr:CCA tRNA nucleotidyltransferase [Solirubrobacter deserti]MBE2315101.1 CCA tRNA nucleotidyltransferase [Solirubrobacter deserti]MDA0141377.1 CCA tRNA nucleotidyltransferase [Solirubrobacter deserti]
MEFLDGERDVYLVGGAVRDELLGRTPKELDFVVEGDAIAVARRVAGRLDAELTVHERFGTATVRTATDAIDFTSARTETYERPGALPTVHLGATLKQDLARRDFTVNAIARTLDGDLIPWTGALADLRGRVLRVLHDRSFIDDPTRMLRLVRYAHRLNFEPDPRTRELFDLDLLQTVSQDRVNREIRLLLDESPHLLSQYGPLSDAPDITAALKLHTRTDVPDADLWRLLRRERPETVDLLVAAGDRGARRYRDHLRHQRLEIGGRDLIERGLTGPAIGAGLERATVAMLEGRAPDRESQLQVALS